MSHLPSGLPAQLPYSSSHSTLAQPPEFKNAICTHNVLSAHGRVFSKIATTPLHPTCTSPMGRWGPCSLLLNLAVLTVAGVTLPAFEAGLQKATQLLPGPPGTRTPGAQPPCREEAQTTYKSHMRVSELTFPAELPANSCLHLPNVCVKEPFHDSSPAVELPPGFETPQLRPQTQASHAGSFLTSESKGSVSIIK